MDAINPNTELNASQTAAPPKSANSGRRQEESICTVESQVGCGEVDEVAVIRLPGNYSNALGFSGALGGT